MEPIKLLMTFLALVPMYCSLSVASSPTTSVASSQPSKTPSGEYAKESAAATLGDLYRKSRQSRCVRCYDDRYDDYDRSRYRGSVYTSSRTYDERPSDWYYPSERYDRYNDRVRYGGDRDYDRYYNNYYGYYRDRNDDRYSTRTYDRYDRDRSGYDSRYSYDRSPSENRGYGYDNRDRYYSNDRTNEYYRGGDRYADRNRVGGSTYDRYGSDDRYYTRYDYRNYRPWDETYRGQSGFDNSGRGYYFASERPSEYYEPPYHPQSRPSGPPTPSPLYLPHENSRPSNSHGYPDSRPGSPSSPSSSSSSPSSSSSSASGSDYGNRPRDDVHGSDNGGGGAGGGRGVSGAADNNKNGYSGGGWSYVNDREKDTGYKGGIRDKDNQSSAYGSGGRGRPLGGSYLLDRDSNVPGGSSMSDQDKPTADGHAMDSPTASKLTSPSSTSTTDDRLAEKKDSN